MDPAYKRQSKAWKSADDARPRIVNIPPAETQQLSEIAKAERVDLESLLHEGLIRVLEDRRPETPAEKD